MNRPTRPALAALAALLLAPLVVHAAQRRKTAPMPTGRRGNGGAELRKRRYGEHERRSSTSTRRVRRGPRRLVHIHGGGWTPATSPRRQSRQVPRGRISVGLDQLSLQPQAHMAAEAARQVAARGTPPRCAATGPQQGRRWTIDKLDRASGGSRALLEPLLRFTTICRAPERRTEARNRALWCFRRVRRADERANPKQ